MSKYINRDKNEFAELNFLSYYLYGHKGFIAGGCFKNIVNKETVKDIDIFFESMSDYEVAVEVYEDNENFIKVFENEKCVGFKHITNGIGVDLVKSIFGVIDHVLSNFDFTIVKFAYRRTFVEFDEDDLPVYEYEIIHHKDFFQHLAQKRLVIDNEFEYITFPVSTFERMFRYAKYGYQPCRETKVKIVSALNSIEDFNSDDISRSLYDGGFD